MTQFSSFVAVGDSFTEGVGDELPDGTVRGWADMVATGLALSRSPEQLTYANLAIRGRLLAPIIADQMDAAIALAPALLSLNGGGNDILRPRVSVESIADTLVAAAVRATRTGIHVVLASGANPTRHLPLGSAIEKRGNRLAAAVRAQLPLDHVTFVDNWADEELTRLDYWSLDKLHLGTLGHRRVAANVLAALHVAIPDVAADAVPDSSRPRTVAYWREYVLPWIGRRLTGRSSGDAREPKSASLRPVVLD
jgi:lysophospholipase L1-like esterase